MQFATLNAAIIWARMQGGRMYITARTIMGQHGQGDVYEVYRYWPAYPSEQAICVTL
jgi:hypothetical protein